MRAAKGEGSAFKSANGYRGYVTVNGKRKYFTAKTKAEAAQKRRELLSRRDEGRLVAGSVPTVAQWMNHWLNNVARLRPTTEAMNRWVIEEKISPELGSIKLSALSAERLEQWVSDLGVSTSSQRRYLAPLKAALEEATKRGHLPFNPARRVDLEPQGKPNTSAFSREDRDAILAAAVGPNSARWHLRLRMGVRPSESLGLTWPDFDEKAGTLTIGRQLLYAKGHGTYLQDAAKTSAGERTLRLPKSLVALLKVHRQEQLRHIAEMSEEWLGWEFGGAPVALIFAQTNGRPLTARMDTTAWNALLTAAGLPRARRYKSRHTAATHMIVDSGGDVAVTAHNLGHADAGFTYRTYVHPLEERAKALAAKMDAPYAAPYDSDVEQTGAEVDQQPARELGTNPR